MYRKNYEFEKIEKELDRIDEKIKKNKSNLEKAKNANEKVLIEKFDSELDILRLERIPGVLKYYKLKNAGNGLNIIDLHRLYENDAIKILEARIENIRQTRLRKLTVITGQGLHSKGPPKLNPAVIKFAKREDIRYQIVENNPGAILLQKF